jgi:hypothetical protein
MHHGNAVIDSLGSLLKPIGFLGLDHSGGSLHLEAMFVMFPEWHRKGSVPGI